MKKFIVGAVLGLCVSLAWAAPASEASVLRLLTASGSDKLMQQMEPAMEQVMRKSMEEFQKDSALSPRQQAVLDTWPKRFAQLVREEMSWEQMKPDIVRIYQESFDQTEIDGLTAFYESPLGQSVISKMPLVMQKSLAMSQAQMTRLMPKMREVIEDIQREAQAVK